MKINLKIIKAEFKPLDKFTKSGDKIRYIKGGILDWESENWTEKDGLVLGNIYEIQRIENGIVKLKGNFNFFYSKEHFIKYYEN